MINKKNSKTLSKENFITLFQFAFDTDIKKVLLTRTKVGIGGGDEFADFYDKILKISNKKSFLYTKPNELDCILTFFDNKSYEKINLPKDYEIIFSLIKFSQKGYNGNNNVKKITKYLNNILDNDLFIQTSLGYFEKSPIQTEDIKNILSKKENVFSVFRLDYIHTHFVANVFNAIYKDYKSIKKDVLKLQVANVIAGRLTNIASLSFYKKLEKIDKYIGTSNFAEQFYEYNLSNKNFINKVKTYKIECEYKDLKNSLTPSTNIEQKRTMKI